jgi:hypothetical protein
MRQLRRNLPRAVFEHLHPLALVNQIPVVPERLTDAHGMCADDDGPLRAWADARLLTVKVNLPLRVRRAVELAVADESAARRA